MAASKPTKDLFANCAKDYANDSEGTQPSVLHERNECFLNGTPIRLGCHGPQGDTVFSGRHLQSSFSGRRTSKIESITRR
jgi:hypothetical protein